MLTKTNFAIGLSAMALLCASPALAQVTAEELWAEWQAQSDAQGQGLTAGQVIDTGSGLELRDVTTAFSDDDVSTSSHVGSMTLTENGDGTVSVDLSEPYSIRIEFETDTAGAPGMIELLMSYDDFGMLVSGPAEARNYAYAASAITVTEGEIAGGSETPEVDLLVTARDVAAQYVVDGTNPEDLSYDSTGTVGSIAIGLFVAPEDRSEGDLKLTFGMTALTSSGGGNLGTFTTLAANPDAVPEGFDFSGDVAYGSVDVEVDFRDGSDAFLATYSNTGGGMSFGFSDTEMSYGFNTQGVSMSAEGSDIPIPVEASAASTEFAFAVPVAASDVPEPFSARIAYENVVLGDMIWAMADPTQAVPRDPISVVMDVSGTVRMLVDLISMDPEGIDAPPGELRSLTVNELRIAAAGAELTGSGDVTFAEGQIIPMPVGSVDLRLAGAFALLDRLQNSGLVPIEQIAMARGLAGAFARPGAAPDTLESTIEFTPGGGITANGVPLQ